jgi:glycosyltransferase involved in cell wall biosynthesis
MPYLTDSDGKIMDSVHFLGRVDEPVKKESLYKETKVGVVNPSGATECCCTSSMEMSAMGIPVITGAANGQFDVVHNGYNGILIKKEKELAKATIKLLKNDELAEKMGNNGISYINENFTPEKIADEWEKNLTEVINGEKAKFKRPNDCMFVYHKIFKLIIHDLKKIPCFKKLPRLSEMKSKSRR